MSENSFNDQGRINISLEQVNFDITPGGTISIPLLVSNQGLEEDILYSQSKVSLRIGYCLHKRFWTLPQVRVKRLFKSSELQAIMKEGPGKQPVTIRASSQSILNYILKKAIVTLSITQQTLTESR